MELTRKKVRLNVNIDHVATVRQARRTYEPSLISAAVLADLAGADGITVHLRGDRRHVQDEDVRTLRSVVKTHLNVEMAVADEMIDIAAVIKPETVTLVPERAEEITTEGGLDVIANEDAILSAVSNLKGAEVLVSIFLDPVVEQIKAAARAGAGQIEICTSRYSELTDPTGHSNPADTASELERVAECARIASELGLQVAAGHGLTYRNVGRIAAIPSMEELNIGHNIVSRAVLVGLERAVRDMIAAINGEAR